MRHAVRHSVTLSERRGGPARTKMDEGGSRIPSIDISELLLCRSPGVLGKPPGQWSFVETLRISSKIHQSTVIYSQIRSHRARCAGSERRKDKGAHPHPLTGWDEPNHPVLL